MVNLGEKIKKLRTERNLTQKQLANMVGVAVSAISSYESGNRYPSYESLISLSRIFHVTTDYLLGIETNRTIDVSHLDSSEIDIILQIIDLMSNHKK